jgi:hypothetical protein
LALRITGVTGYKRPGNNRPLDIQVTVTDQSGVPVNGATVAVSASNGVDSWAGTLSNTGSGLYTVCDMGSFDGSAAAIRIDALATKAGYTPDFRAGNAQSGNMPGCP